MNEPQIKPPITFVLSRFYRYLIDSLLKSKIRMVIFPRCENERKRDLKNNPRLE